MGRSGNALIEDQAWVPGCKIAQRVLRFDHLVGFRIVGEQADVIVGLQQHLGDIRHQMIPFGGLLVTEHRDDDRPLARSGTRRRKRLMRLRQRGNGVLQQNLVGARGIRVEGRRCRSGQWLEFGGGVISSLVQQAIPAYAGGDHALPAAPTTQNP